jgi:murein DD-endopeptidase MepM/ murein hydrolase activator NlpD
VQQSDPSYRYGTTQDGAREPHHGVDLGNAFGTPVYAAADGEVVFAGSDSAEPVSPWKNFYGNVVVIEHALPGLSAPVFTLYGHLSAMDTSLGETVRAGDKIGEVGASGVALGSHLHFEVRVGTNDYASTHNPELWLAPAPPANAGERDATGGTLAVRAVDSHGNLVPLTLDVQYFVEPSGPVTKTFPVEAYDKKEKFPINSDDVLGENFVLGSLPPGRYRLSFVYWGVLYERWMDVAPGELTFAEFALQ